MLQRGLGPLRCVRRSTFKSSHVHCRSAIQPSHPYIARPPSSTAYSDQRAASTALSSHSLWSIASTQQRRLLSASSATSHTPTPTVALPYPDPSPPYEAAYQQSISNPSAFWSQAADAISWYSTAGPVLRYNSERPHDCTWFPDRTLNTAYNCLDLHCQEGRGEQTAVIYDSPLSGVKQRITYGELLEQVSELAGAMRAAGIGIGDVVMVSTAFTFLVSVAPRSLRLSIVPTNAGKCISVFRCRSTCP